MECEQCPMVLPDDLALHTMHLIVKHGGDFTAISDTNPISKKLAVNPSDYPYWSAHIGKFQSSNALHYFKDGVENQSSLCGLVSLSERNHKHFFPNSKKTKCRKCDKMLKTIQCEGAKK